MTMHATETDAIRKTVTVPLPVEKAFNLFTAGIDTWWPFESHSIGGEKTESAVFDVEAKRLYEREADGSEHDWADIVGLGAPEPVPAQLARQPHAARDGARGAVRRGRRRDPRRARAPGLGEARRAEELRRGLGQSCSASSSTRPRLARGAGLRPRRGPAPRRSRARCGRRRSPDSTSAPWSRRSCAIAASPFCAAACSAVKPPF